MATGAEGPAFQIDRQPSFFAGVPTESFPQADFPVPIQSFTNYQFPNCAGVVTDLAWGRAIATRLDLAKKWRLSF